MTGQAHSGSARIRPDMPPATILFGAFDRHNVGDMLFPHIAARMLGGSFLFAGLVERDFRALGGHHVLAINDVISRTGQPVSLIHAGGEILDCDAWEAAVMVADHDQAVQAVRRLDQLPGKRTEWAQRQLSIRALAPYVVSRGSLPEGSTVHFNAVGGIGLDARDVPYRNEVLCKLREATSVSVRDRQTHALLARHGIQAALLPDPAVMAASLFASEISAHRERGEVQKVRQLFPNGYLAVQCSADFDDDASIDMMATQLEQLSAQTGLACVFFRAGAAPWHDSLECLGRIERRIMHATTFLFQSLDVWDICALLASSRLVCASSLHARILAMAFGLPRLTFRPHGEQALMNKHEAYLATWEHPDLPRVIPQGRILASALDALQTSPALLAAHARTLSDCYRQSIRQG
jgi:hypothetical protein